MQSKVLQNRKTKYNYNSLTNRLPVSVNTATKYSELITETIAQIKQSHITGKETCQCNGPNSRSKYEGNVHMYNAIKFCKRKLFWRKVTLIEMAKKLFLTLPEFRLLQTASKSAAYGKTSVAYQHYPMNGNKARHSRKPRIKRFVSLLKNISKTGKYASLRQ